MTLDNQQGPGGETPSAPFFSVPAFSLHYSLDWRDALVWENLPAELSGLQKAVYIGFQVAGGMAYGIAASDLPGWLAGLPTILVILPIVGLMHLLWKACFALWKRHRAKRMFPRRIQCLFEDWDEYIYIHDERQEGALYVELFRQIVLTPTHLFIEFSGTLIIIPVTAFDSAAQCSAFVERWERLSDEARD